MTGRVGPTLPQAPSSGRWMRHAACRDHPNPDLFFPDQGKPLPPEVAQLCAGCPVRQRCRHYALALPAFLDHGIWGGLTETQRQQIRQGPAAPADLTRRREQGNARAATCRQRQREGQAS